MQLGLCIDLNRVRILQSGRIISFLFVHGLSIFCPVTRSGFERGKNTNPFIIPIINPISPFAPITRPDLTRSKQGWPDFFFSAPRVGLIIIYRCTIPSVICTKALFYTSNQIDPREFTKELSRIAIRDHPSYPNQVLWSTKVSRRRFQSWTWILRPKKWLYSFDVATESVATKKSRSHNAEMLVWSNPKETTGLIVYS